MSSQKWIVFLLFTDRRSIHMSRQDFRLIRQRQKLILDAPHKIRHTAAPTISEADQEGFVTLCYPLPQKLGAGNYPIRFSPDGTEWTPAIYEIRLLE